MATPLGCSEFRSETALNRRGFLQAGLLGAGGLSLAGLLRSEAQAGTGSSDRSVIILWMRGGPSHIDTWDPKPLAPAEYRGEFGTISTSVPGVQLIDLLPRSAAMMHKWSIIRSMHHNEPGHSAGDQLCFTGYNPGPIPEENIHPSCGSIVAEQLGHLTPDLPPYVMIPKMDPGTDSAYLGVACKPFETQADPIHPGPFQIPNFALPEGLTVNRLDDRRELINGLDRVQAQLDTAGQMQAMDRFQSQAWNILSSPKAKEAFNLDAEPHALRERYGFLPTFDPMDPTRCGCKNWSQRILLARRLVEAGVRLVTVDVRWWDTHKKNFESLKLGFLERWDRAFTTLIEDLEQRGMLEKTLIVAWGEFGRTPLVNKDAGRDHYPNVFSAALAGGPILGGRVVGASDTKGALPKSNPKTPQDVLATIYDFLGVDVHKHYLDNAGRPIPVLSSGTPIAELLS